MSQPIAIFYHCLFQRDKDILPLAFELVPNQIEYLRTSGLMDEAKEIHVGVNGGKESEAYASGILPRKANVVYHGLDSYSENMTLVMLEEFTRTHPGWYCLYFHTKGVTHIPGSDYEQFATRWRRCMMYHTIGNWKLCVMDLDRGFEACGCHWLNNQADGTQHYFAGNFFWVKSDFHRTIPSIFTRKRIKMSGIKAKESRYEAEVILGNGKRRPVVMDYHPEPIGSCAI